MCIHLIWFRLFFRYFFLLSFYSFVFGIVWHFVCVKSSTVFLRVSCFLSYTWTHICFLTFSITDALITFVFVVVDVFPKKKKHTHTQKSPIVKENCRTCRHFGRSVHKNRKRYRLDLLYGKKKRLKRLWHFIRDWHMKNVCIETDSLLSVLISCCCRVYVLRHLLFVSFVWSTNE